MSVFSSAGSISKIFLNLKQTNKRNVRPKVGRKPAFNWFIKKKEENRMMRSSGFLRTGVLAAALALGSLTLSTPTLARGGGGGGHGGGFGGGHGGGFGGGHFGGGGFGGGHFGGHGFGGGHFGDHGFGGRGFAGRGFYGGYGGYGGYDGWGYPYDYAWGYPYDDYGGYPQCSIRRTHVHTAYGWRWRNYEYC